MRRFLPKTYRKVMKIEYKHFTHNLKNGTCTIPAHLQDVPLAVDGEALALQYKQIAELQKTRPAAAAPVLPTVCRIADQVINARQMLARMRRKSLEHATTTAVSGSSSSSNYTAIPHQPASECV